MQNTLEGADQKIFETWDLSITSFVYLIKIAIEAERLHYNVLTFKHV